MEQHGVRDIHVFPNGTDATPLATLEPKPLAAPIRLVAVSRLAPNKRVDHVIRAAKILLQRGVDVQLTVVGTGDGTGEMEASLHQLAADSDVKDKIEFTGRLDEAKKKRPPAPGAFFGSHFSSRRLGTECH